MKKIHEHRHEKRPRQLAEQELRDVVGGKVTTKEPTKLEFPNLKVT